MQVDHIIILIYENIQIFHYRFIEQKVTEKIIPEPEPQNTVNIKEKCPENLFETLTGECVIDCPRGTYQFMPNRKCLESCPQNYKVNIDKNRCKKEIFEEKTIIKELKTE